MTYTSSIITFLDRLKLLFYKRQVHWDTDEGLITIYKVRKGVFYLLHQEPIAYGDARNHQLSRLGL